MKTYILSDTVQKKLSFLNHAVASRSELPILLNFLIVAKNNNLTISATDLEIGIVTSLPATIEEEGEITVPAKVFLELIGSIGTDKIILETKEKSLHLKGKNVRASFQTIDASEFPKLFSELGIVIAKCAKDTLDNALSTVVFAAAQDSSRPALSGVLFKRQNQKDANGFLFVATDGYRLSLKTQSIANTAKDAGGKDLIIPARTIKELLAMKGDGDEVLLRVSEKQNQILFSEGDTTLVGRLIEAEFPSYEKIIPNEYTTRALFDREEMLKAVKICSIFARETANIVKLSVKKDKITISANATSVGEDNVDMDAKVSGEENEIAFNARYLLDLLNNVDAKNMVFEMTGPLNPGVFKIENDVSFLHIIMPIRVQG